MNFEYDKYFVEKLQKLIAEKDKEIAALQDIISTLNPCGHKGIESKSCDICGYPDSRKLIEKLRQEIARLKDKESNRTENLSTCLNDFGIKHTIFKEDK